MIAAEAANLGDGPGAIIAGGLVLMAFGAGGIWRTRTWRSTSKGLGPAWPRFDRAYDLAGHVAFGAFVVVGLGYVIVGVGRLLLSVL